MSKPIKQHLGYQNYKGLADSYALSSVERPFNRYFEQPAIKSLLPVVKGKRLLDIGCGAGVLSEWLLEQGATVTAFDISPTMVDHAKRRNQRFEDRFAVRNASMEDPLEFVPGKSVDIAVCSLVIEYLPDLIKAFSEVSRVLKPAGLFVFSCAHPFLLFSKSVSKNYHEVELLELTWKYFGEPYPTVRVYRRKLEEILAASAKAGFLIDTIIEPLPSPEYAEHDQVGYEKLSREPRLLCCRVKKAE